MLHRFILYDELFMLDKILLQFRTIYIYLYTNMKYTCMKFTYVYLFIFCNVCSKFNTLPTDHGFNQL